MTNHRCEAGPHSASMIGLELLGFPKTSEISDEIT
jgi:hypothetical protein